MRRRSPTAGCGSSSATCATTTASPRPFVGRRLRLPRRRAQAGSVVRVLPAAGREDQRPWAATTSSRPRRRPACAVVCLSTDKAVYPVNAMGMSKALMEKTAQAFARNNPTSATTVSSPATATSCTPAVRSSRCSSSSSGGRAADDHRADMTRFLMSLRGVRRPRRARIHPCRARRPVRPQGARLHDRGAGASASPDCGVDEPEIRVIGTRHGEKLHETLLSQRGDGQGRRTRATTSGSRWTPVAGVRAVLRGGRASAHRSPRRLHVRQHPAAGPRSRPRSLLLELPEMRSFWYGASAVKVLLTGAAGFLGWHTRVRLRRPRRHEVVPSPRADGAQLPDRIDGVDAVVHVAGVNRGRRRRRWRRQHRSWPDRRCSGGSHRRAGVRSCVFANSIQAGNDTPYGAGKAVASERPRRGCCERGSKSSTCGCRTCSVSTAGRTTTPSSRRSSTR